VHRRELREAGISRDEVRSEIRAGRWASMGRHTVYLGTPTAYFGSATAVPGGGGGGSDDSDPRLLGPPEWPARAWWAGWESGAGAVLDGVSALLAAGLEHYTERDVHVTLPRNARGTRLVGVQRRWTRVRRTPIGSGLPRVSPEVAVVNAAQWAVSDRQAATLLTMAVQQRLTTGARVLEEWSARARSPRRSFLDTVVRDVADGAQALGELDFGRLCRARGLPTPSRQVVRKETWGRVYLDVWWEEHGVGAEIDGAQHGWGLSPVRDALRDNEVMMADGPVLRIPLLGLRVAPDPFMDQVERLITLGTQRRTEASRRSGQG
jgi:very-short-patch-repair endonuclease